MKKQYENLNNYELNLLEMRWEEEHQDEEDAPADEAGWKAYYESLPDDVPSFREEIDGLQLYADDSGAGRVMRCARCHGEAHFVAIYDAENKYLGDGFTCPNCAQARITRLP